MSRQRHKKLGRLHAHRRHTAQPDEQGQRLDAARAAFRAEWQAKVNRKRQRAAQIRGIADQVRKVHRKDPRKIPIVGGCLGTGILGTVVLLRFGWQYLPFGIVLGFFVGYLVALPLIPVGPLMARLCQQWATRCERSADLMEPSRRHRSR